MFLKRSWILRGSMDKISKIWLDGEKARKHKANKPTITTSKGADENVRI